MFEIRNASCVSRIKIKGITIGKAEINIRKKIIIDLLRSLVVNLTCNVEPGSFANFFLICSSSAASSTEAIEGGNESEIYFLALASSEVVRTESRIALFLLR